MTTNRNPASTSATQGIAPRRPPKALFKYVMNPAMTLLLRSPLHRRISGSLALLSYTGRKSGKRFTTPVGYHRTGEHILVFTHSPWWKNFEGGAPVTMLIEGKEVHGHAEAIRGPDEIFTHVEPLVRKYGAKQARRMALTLDPNREPTADELRAAIGAQELIMLRIRPQNA